MDKNKSFAVPTPVRPTPKRATVDNKASTSKNVMDENKSFAVPTPVRPTPKRATVENKASTSKNVMDENKSFAVPTPVRPTPKRATVDNKASTSKNVMDENKSFAVPTPVRPTPKRATVDNKASTSKNVMDKNKSFAVPTPVRPTPKRATVENKPSTSKNVMDKNKSFAVPTPVRPTPKRATVDNKASTSKNVMPKDRAVSRKSVLPCNLRSNTTLFDESIIIETEGISDVETSGNDYETFYRNIFTDCLVEENQKREKTELDVQMAQMGDRLQKTMEQLDKTSQRLKDINFVVEQKRLKDLTNQDTSNFYNMIDNSGLEETISRLTVAEEVRLDNLETRNINMGYNNETGHKELLDTVNDAIEGLESIKKKYDLGTNIFNEYQELHTNIDKIEKDRLSIDSFKSEFDIKFPKYSEELLKDIAVKVASFIENDD